MDRQLWVACVAILLILIRLLHLSYVNGKRRLPLPPGPDGLPLIGSVLQVPFDYQHVTFAKWRKQYGDIIHARFFQKDVIILNSVRSARDLLDKRGQKYSDRPRLVMFNELMYVFHPNLSTMRYGERWRQHRGWYQTALQTRNALNSYQPLQEKEARKFLSALTCTPDVFISHISRFAGSTLLQIAYGYSDDEFIHMADKVNTDIMEVGGAGATVVDFFPILKYLPTWMPGTGFKRKALQARDAGLISRTVPFERVKKDIASGTAKPSFTRNLLEKNASVDSESFEFEVKGAASVIYGAGTDTTITSITIFVLAMVLNPEVYKKAQAELDDVVGRKRLPNLSDRNSLPYLDCVLKEVYRWGSPVPLGLPHGLVEDDEYRGYHIPRGAMVLANIWAMGRDPEVYPDPEIFSPERYQNVQPDVEDLMDPRKTIFGFGRRICPGRLLADASVWIAAASILATMTISKAHDANGNEIVPEAAFVSGTVIHPKPFQCDIRPRSAEAMNLIMTEAHE
ncbi:cytochrome P450 monooxygenase [Laetiporus sulphureus 93-53]|uniref:Cytochrome P450 monooxygenase n=1 Tax=Laetiporus sulphureus 93-53 TaxID=1314785 RepID=A0A165CPE6_9APHY|nr:cytochrome P450 monooxygenase [Laetiporus sulphureus 93-53]KZT03178.1 cytochrome P450 monooxygenase [Laetiporus sulphureus 93-53]